MKKILLIAFLLVALLQLAVPAKMILDREEVLSQGQALKFKTAPVDPNDPFRGKYVYLQFTHDQVKISNKQKWDYQEPVYAQLKSGADGFARVVALSKEEPQTELPYMKVKISYSRIENNKQILTLEFPFDRFYMEESKAPEAEQVYLEQNLDDDQRTYALVKVKEGEAVLEDLYINDVPIKQVVEQNRKN